MHSSFTFLSNRLSTGLRYNCFMQIRSKSDIQESSVFLFPGLSICWQEAGMVAKIIACCAHATRLRKNVSEGKIGHRARNARKREILWSNERQVAMNTLKLGIKACQKAEHHVK